MPLGDLVFADDVQPSFGLGWIPVLPRERLEAMSMEELQAYAAARKTAEDGAVNNPVGAGWTLPMWDKVMANWKKYPIIVILGGQRSSKSSLAARLSVWAAGTIPQAEVRCYHVNEDRSIEDQQRFIWDCLPVSIRNIQTKKGIAHSLQYSQKNGFTDNIAILPPHPGYRRGGSIKFGNYRQYQQDAQVTEGFKAHVIWGDEEMPQKMLETLIYRTVDFHGRIILTFTTLMGWSPLIQDILGRTRVIEKRFAPLVGKELPTIRESLSRPGAVIYNFWTEDNAFIDTGDFRKKIIGRPKAEILARAYGEPTKSITTVFPQFSKEVHVVPHESLPFIKDPKYPVTRYMSLDPAGRKRWFFVYVAVDAAGTWWVYREWPDTGYGEWALPGTTVEGKPGPAQQGDGKGIKEYVELIRDMEKDEELYERIIDSRLGAAQKQAEEGATTLMTELEDAGLTFIPAPGGGAEGRGEIEDGLQLINNLLSWDENKKRDSMNTPKMFFSDRCQNVISAMENYTAQGGPSENHKDPVDCLRMLRKANCEFYELKMTQDNTPTGCY